MRILNRPTFGLLLAALAPAALAAQQPAPAATGPTLTLEQALASARANNPDLLSQQNDTRSSRAAVRAARADFFPSASASTSFGYTAAGEQRFASEVFGQRPVYYSSVWNLGLDYQLSGAKLMQPAIARAQERATVQRIVGYEANLVGQVVQQYLSGLQAEEQVAQAERERLRTVEHERLARARLEVGAGTPLDLRRAEVQRGQAEVTLVQRRNDYQTELLRLQNLVGRVLPPDTRLTSRFELFAPRWNADSLVERALQNNPNLLAARASARAARTNVRAARSAYLPSLNFSVGMRGEVYSAGNIDPLVADQLRNLENQFEGCKQQNVLLQQVGLPTQDCSLVNPGSPAVQSAVRQEVASNNPSFPFDYTRQPLQASVSFSLPIFDGLRRERQIEEARVSADDADLAVRSTELRMRTDISAAVLALQTTYRLAQLQEELVKTAAEELRLAQERFRFGLATSVEVTDAQTSLAQAEQARIDAIYNFQKSLANLEALVGTPLR
ncbi:MAG TPA: TolC family protein [Longimicrobiaceae bacterium]|nr:TolC family protein [Longimicrobiaceae bacterium]